MKSLVIWLKFHWSCAEGCNWKLPSTGLDSDLAPSRRQTIIWTDAVLIDWRIYVALGGDELNQIQIQIQIQIQTSIGIRAWISNYISVKQWI